MRAGDVTLDLYSFPAHATFVLSKVKARVLRGKHREIYVCPKIVVSTPSLGGN